MKRRILQYFACIIFIVLIIFAFLAIKNYKKPNSVIVKSSALIKDNTYDYKDELKVYLDTDSNGICYKETKECGKEYLRIKTASKGAYLIDNYKFKYFFYIDDNKVKVFDSSIVQSYIIDTMDPSYVMDFVIDRNDNLIGVVFTEDLNETANYLLVYSNEIIYKKKYNYISSISPKYLTANKYDSNGNQTGSYIINAYKESNPLISKEINSDGYYGFFELGKSYITFEYDNKIEIYNNDTLELIYKTAKLGSLYANGNPRFLYSVDKDDYLYIYNDKNLIILDDKGKEIQRSKNEIEGIDLIDKYIINTETDEITITDIDNNKISIAKIDNGKLEYYDYVDEKEKNGILFYVSDNLVNSKKVYDTCKKDICKGLSLEEFEKEFKNSFGYEYYFDYNTAKVTKKVTLIEHIDEEE